MNERKLKVGIFVGLPGHMGGAESVVYRLVTTLKRDYPEFIIPEVYTTEDNTWLINECRKNDIMAMSLPKSVMKNWSFSKLPFFIYHFGKFLKERNVDVVNSHCFTAISRAMFTCKFYKIPHVATTHDNYTVEDKPSRIRWFKLMSWWKQKLVVVSDISKRIHCRIANWDYETNKIEVIYNGIDLSLYEVKDEKKTELKERLGLNDKFVFTSVGRLFPIKRFDRLLYSFHLFLSNLNNTNSVLLIAGSGPEQQNLEKLAHSLQIYDKVIFLGDVDYIPELLSISDVFVLTSDSEGMSCSILEALASGLPVIATNVGGNRELVRDHYNGLLTDLKTTEIARHMDFIFTHKRLGRLMGKKSLEASKRFSVEKMTSRYYIECFKAFIEQH